MSEENDEHVVIGTRLREAREYVGLLQEEVAAALGIPRTSLSAAEAASARCRGWNSVRLARLYRRSVGWFSSDDDDDVSDAADPLYRATAQLSAHDKDQVLRFAEFLAAAGQPGPADPSTGKRAGARKKKTDT